MATDHQDLKLVVERHMGGPVAALMQLLQPATGSNSSISALLEPPCHRKLLEMGSSALAGEPWALKVFDASARLGSGLAAGGLLRPQQQQELCESAGAPVDAHLCLAHVRAGPQLMASLKPLLDFELEPGVSAAQLGVCVPRICQPKELGPLVEHLLAHVSSGLTVSQVDCGDAKQVLLGSLSTTLPLLLLFILVIGCLIATLVDETGQTFSRRKGRHQQLVSSMSLRNSYKQLMRPRATRRNSFHDLTTLDGVRVLSSFWVIAVHSYSFALEWLHFDNVAATQTIYTVLGTQWLANGTFSVDNFIVLSGFLARLKLLHVRPATELHSSLAEAAPNIRPSTSLVSKLGRLCKLLAARYLRLAPVLLALIWLSVSVLPAVSSGPNWSRGTRMFAQWCATGWPLNVAMVQNLMQTPAMCFSHSWYVAVDWQLFVLVHLVHTLVSSKRVLLIIALLAGIGAQLVSALTVYSLNLPAAPMLKTSSWQAMIDYYRLVYIKPHYWLSSYLMGMALAELTCNQMQRRQRRRASKATEMLGNLAWLWPAIMCLIVSSLWPYFAAPVEGQMSAVSSAVYVLLARPLWAVCLCCCLWLAMQTSRRGPGRHLRALLKAVGWPQLARLSYLAYLLHPVVMGAFYGSRSGTLRFSHALLVYFTLGHLALTYAGALIVHLIVEAPLKAMLGACFGPASRSLAATRPAMS